MNEKEEAPPPPPSPPLPPPPPPPPPPSYDLVLDRLKQNVEANPNKKAVTFLEPGPEGGKVQKSLIYQRLWDETTSVAGSLQAQHGSLKKGDRVVLVYPPSLDFMVAFLACLKLQVVAVPVFPPNPNRSDTLKMFCKICQNCQPTLALTNQEYNYLKKLSGIRDKLKLKSSANAALWPEDLKWIITDQSSNPKKDLLLSSATTPIQGSDVAFLQYTSGSTSDPKGVMITHGNLAHNLTIITNELQAADDTVVVSWLPQYHDMGLIGSYLGLLYCGGTGYYISPLSFLQRPMLWLEAVSRYQATHLQAPNFAFKLTARKFQASEYQYSGPQTSKSSSLSNKTLDLSSVRHVINAAEPVDEESMQTFYKEFGPFGFGKVIFPTYGLAEHTVFVCSGGTQCISCDKQELEIKGNVVVVTNNVVADQPPAAPDEGEAEEKLSQQQPSSTMISRLVGCGYPDRQGVDVRIVDHESLVQLEEGKVGEIWVKSPSKAAGYYNKPEETKHDFHGHMAGTEETDDGYLRTGDLGFLYNKELFICGRLKDLIIVGGRNYYPQDIEATAEAAADLVRPGCSAAFTIDQTKSGGEEVALVMELKEVPSAKDVERICLLLANQVKAAVSQEHSLSLAEIVFLKPRTVPKTSSGKIARSWCRKGFVGGTLSVVFRKNFAAVSGNATPLEIEPATDTNDTPKTTKAGATAAAATSVDAQTIRDMSKQQLVSKLIADLANFGSLSPDSIDKDAPLVTILSSLDLAQFKGLFENQYACKISDDYLFRDSTSLSKLADVAKLGYAPDDEGDDAAGAGGGTMQPGVGGKAKGLAGVLGCPPGVRCVIL